MTPEEHWKARAEAQRVLHERYVLAERMHIAAGLVSCFPARHILREGEEALRSACAHIVRLEQELANLRDEKK